MSSRSAYMPPYFFRLRLAGGMAGVGAAVVAVVAVGAVVGARAEGEEAGAEEEEEEEISGLERQFDVRWVGLEPSAVRR
ncbi:hypothetical protein B484DRAFT_424387 [Ochromonadaceae sp. CCMP2298]|nr:hypothetical protein B484DRAFT_424387 [Ochromonadaceae sp. CCMP2298]